MSSNKKKYELFEIIEFVKKEYKKGNKIGRKRLQKLFNLSESDARKILNIVEYEIEMENNLEKFLSDKKLYYKTFSRKIDNFIRLATKHRNVASINKIDKKSKEENYTYLLLLSDWHIGEVVSEEEVSYSNKFDLEVATRRVELIYENIYEIVKADLDKHKKKKLDSLYVWLGGDMVSGIIHNELEKTNQLTISDQVFITAQLLYYLLTDLLEIFKDLYIICSVGNHGRITKKPEYKNKYNTFDYMLYKTLYVMFNSLDDKSKSRIHWYISKELFSIVNILGYNFVFSHGDTIRMWNNIPYYGIIRDLYSKQSISLTLNKGKIDYYVIGHFHTPSSLNVNGIYVIMNGSLKGIDEYSLAKGFISIPSQKLLKISSDRGLMIQYDLILTENTIYQKPKRYKISII